MSDKAELIVKRVEKLISDRGTLDAHMGEVARMFFPQFDQMFQASGDTANANSRQLEGRKKMQDILDPAGVRALDRFSSIMDSMTTPRNQKWHTLLPVDRDLLRKTRVKRYFYDLNTKLFSMRYNPQSNFAGQNRLTHKGAAAFGTAGLYVDADLGKRILRYRHVHIGNIYFGQNHQGIINEAYRIIDMTAAQIAREPDFSGKVPQDILDMADDPSRADQIIQVIHAVTPNTDYNSSEPAVGKNLPFRVLYTFREPRKNIGSDEYIVLGEGLLASFPYPTMRYSPIGNQVYGFAPAMMALPSVKSLQLEKTAFLEQSMRAGRPILLTHDDGVLDNISLRPGANVPGGVSARGELLVQPLPVGNISVTENMMQTEKDDINQAFLLDLFQLLRDDPRKTATEVLQQAQEQAMLLEPTSGQIETDYSSVLIERELSLLAEMGKMPELPPELKEAASYTVQYENPITKASRAGEASGLFRILESILPIINITGDTSPLDVFDMDELTRDIADIQSVPPSWLRPRDEVDSLREQRAMAQQQAAMQEKAAENMKALAAAKKAGVTEEDL